MVKIEQGFIKEQFPSDCVARNRDLFMSVNHVRLNKSECCCCVCLTDFLCDNVKVEIKKKLFGEFNVHTIIRLPHSVFAPYTSITTNIIFFDKTTPTTETWFYRLDMPEGYKHFSKTKYMRLDHFNPAIEWWNDRKEINLEGFDKSKKYTIKEIADKNYNIELCGYPQEEEEILQPEELIRKYHRERADCECED